MAIEGTVATASTYDPTLRGINVDTDTVQGQITGLLDSDSRYIERARARGIGVANSRGLLNSSMAAGASEASAIDAALPIAQQDASTYLQQGMANQSASNTAGSTNAQLKTNVSTANAANATGLEQTRMGETGAMARLEKSEAGALERANIGEAGALERTNISEAGAMTRANLSADTTLASANISAETSRYSQEQTTLRNNATIAANREIEAGRIDQSNAQGYATAYANIGTLATSERNTIINSDMSGEQKTEALAALKAYEIEQRIDIGPIFGVEVTLAESTGA